MWDQTIKVCSAASGYPEICYDSFIPDKEDSVIIVQKMVPSMVPYPTPTLIPNLTGNITSSNLTEPFVLPNWTIVDKDSFRDQITNNSIIGDYAWGITSYMDALGETINQTVMDTIEFIDVPFDFLIDIQLAAHNLYLAILLPLIPFTYLPLLITGKFVAILPWEIAGLISLGLLVDLFFLILRGSGGS
jgi:hypothetical protein